MNSYPDHLHITQLSDWILGATTPLIQRTSTRIHELIRLDHPESRENPFFTNRVHFSMILFSLVDDAELSVVRTDSPPRTRYEEGMHEPILFEDTHFAYDPLPPPREVPHVVPYEYINTRSLIIERELYGLLCEWVDLKEALERVQRLPPLTRAAYVAEWGRHGMIPGNLYFTSRWETRRSPEVTPSAQSFPRVYI